MVNADPARTPTFAMFAKPDYFLSTAPATCSSRASRQNTGFAWDHGDYAAEIDTNYAAFAGPGVAHLGLDGTSAANRARTRPARTAARSKWSTAAPPAPGWTRPTSGRR